jgi:hypothetical protein
MLCLRACDLRLALAAIQSFLCFQTQDHQTGDSLELE